MQEHLHAGRGEFRGEAPQLPYSPITGGRLVMECPKCGGKGRIEACAADPRECARCGGTGQLPAGGCAYCEGGGLDPASVAYHQYYPESYGAGSPGPRSCPECGGA